MIQKHRILTEVGKDKKITLELKQDYDLLEILSLKFSQQQAYTSLCADYGVVCGRISVNNGFGIPNARVSIFVPLSTTDEDDPVISALYPYKQIEDKDENGYRYNLLPSRKQHGGHEPTGTFFDQSDILNEEAKLEVFEKYYSLTVKTNTSGDFMIWGVPLGQQTLHVDVDLSDIGCFSQRPDDFIRQGMGVDQFKNSYSFKASKDLSSLPQIISFTRTIDVYPFWGNIDLCEIGLTRTDFDLSDEGVKIEPKAYLLGSVFKDTGANGAISKNCYPQGFMGQKCRLESKSATIEVIRFTSSKDRNNRPILEKYEIEEDIEDDGSFVLSLPMNMEYEYTNEFGEIEITNDPNKGIPTSACYRFRISMKESNMVGTYLVPNIREYSNDEDKSYSWSINWSDYPTSALNENVLFKNEYGSFYPQDYFYRMTYNKVYGVSSFIGSYFGQGGAFGNFDRQSFLGLKEISPKNEDDCTNSVNTPPINWATQKFNFSILLAIILNTFENIIYKAFVYALQIIIFPLNWMYENFKFNVRAFGACLLCWEPFNFLDTDVIEPLQRFGTVRLGTVIYPECETCDNINVDIEEGAITSFNPVDRYLTVGYGQMIKDNFSVMADFNSNFSEKLYLTSSDPTEAFYSGTTSGMSITDLYTSIQTNPLRYLIYNDDTEKYSTLVLTGFTDNSVTYYSHLDQNNVNNWVDWSDTGTEVYNYKILDNQTTIIGSEATTEITESMPSGCAQYMTLYDENMVYKTYCTTLQNLSYSALTTSNLYAGSFCTVGFEQGQVIAKAEGNPCGTCGLKSGYSEFRNGLFTIIPAASTKNWNVNMDAINEYTRRKLVGKLFCEGVGNYSFIDNWLTGALYFFQFKSKIKWDDENILDLNYRSSKYCKDLVYFKVGTIDDPHKRFYYRSSYFTGNIFKRQRNTLGFPTTIVDLGPRDEFIKEICVDPSLDPNCSVVRSIGPTSYQNFKEMFGLYINYKMDYLGPSGNYTKFFDNTGFNNIVPNKLKKHIMNGDILQLISINNEAGIEEFDLQDRKYAVYSPRLLDVEEYPDLLNGGPLPINLQLDPLDGYRVRSCLNEPSHDDGSGNMTNGRLTESSQLVPFYLWDKKGTGFGDGINQSWDYSSVQIQPLQGMTYGYRYSGETSHPYILFPMTKEYGGLLLTYTGITFNDVYANVESDIVGTHFGYNNQEEGFTVLEVNNMVNPTSGVLWTRKGNVGGWVGQTWTNDLDFVIKPTSDNYLYTKQILSTPFLFYFGLRPGKTAVDKFYERFGPKGAFPSAE